MKIRHPLLIKLLGILAAVILRLWMKTIRYRFMALGEDSRPDSNLAGRRHVYVGWHEYILLPLAHYARPQILVLISQHADGQLIAEVCRRFGFSVVRGSTTRGGAAALREMLRRGRELHLAMTPDGPRGPRRHVHQGAVYLASITGLAVVPIGVGYGRCWRLKSWDRFAVPWPLTVGRCVTLQPIHVPANLDKAGLEEHRQRVEDAMLKATALAEKWATTGQPPVPADGRYLTNSSTAAA